MVKENLYGLTCDGIFSLIRPYGFSISHAVSISNSIYKKGVVDIFQIAKIPKKLKEELSQISFIGTFRYIDCLVSKDETVKYLFKTESGKKFETVFIPEKKRNTVCVSTQSGCRMGCLYCATARIGFKGNLSAGEIINQVISIPDAGKVTHVVFMGMGEPLDNLAEVLKACEILTSEWGLAISPRNVTVSTVGITPGVEIFLRESGCNLTVSLHSPFSDERKKLAPSEKAFPVETIIETIKNFPVRKKRRLSISYVMMNGINDSDSHLKSLIMMLTGSGIRVNLLSFHNTGDEMIVTSSGERMHYFKHSLVVSGISASVRKSRGTDIRAACGLLAAD